MLIIQASLSVALTSTLVAAASYAPVHGNCPAGTTLIRPAQGVNPSEAAFVAQRYPQASKSLAAWLAKTDSTFPVLNANQYPMMALIDGGGGLRGFTVAAGIHKAFDANEPDAANYATAGLYQSFTYEAALSGTALMLYSYVQNNWALTSTLLSQLWTSAFAAGVSNPPGGIFTQQLIASQVLSKQASGFATSITDVWGRILSYTCFQSPFPGISNTVSNFTSLPGYTSFTRPYPIVTAIGIENDANGCGLPPLNASQYEFTPHEFGSWETGIGNFIQTKYLGTSMSNGSPTAGCVTGYDNVGWIAGTSSSTFNQACSGDVGFFTKGQPDSVAQIYKTAAGGAQQNNYATVANPFASLASAPRVSSEQSLTLVDGGETIQVPPIWPFLYRPKVNVLVVSDNSADNPSNYKSQYPTGNIDLPNGQQIWHTYQQAKLNGVSARMPYIPPPSAFMAAGYNKRPMTFFGCNLPANSPAMFIIYLPNRPVVTNSNVAASDTQYNATYTAAMVANGEAIATNSGDANFATCMACGIMKVSAAKAGKSLPAACAACFVEYCS